MSDFLELHAIFSGQVQGVSFRATTQKFARKLGLVGEVKNLPDGSVELFAQGPSESLRSLLDLLQGPNGPGRIDSVKTDFSSLNRKFFSFHVVDS